MESPVIERLNSVITSLEDIENPDPRITYINSIRMKCLREAVATIEGLGEATPQQVARAMYHLIRHFSVSLHPFREDHEPGTELGMVGIASSCVTFDLLVALAPMEGVEPRTQ